MLEISTVAVNSVSLGSYSTRTVVSAVTSVQSAVVTTGICSTHTQSGVPGIYSKFPTLYSSYFIATWKRLLPFVALATFPASLPQENMWQFRSPSMLSP